MSRETKDELGERLIYESRRSEAANDAFDEAAARALGINRTDLRCLNVIENQGPLTAGRIAELSGLTTAAVTSVLDKLEDAGYARRTRDTEDRRRVLVEVTPLMYEKGEKIWGPLGEEARAAMRELSVADLKLITEFYEWSRELNERHVERVRKLSLG